MKKNVLKILIIGCIMIFAMAILNCSYAADDNVVTMHSSFYPSNPKQGGEITIEISSTVLKEGITGVGFNLEYDSEKIEFVSITAESGWKADDPVESLFTIFTSDSEATTTTGKIATIKLKVKESAAVSETQINIKNMEVTTDDAKIIPIKDSEPQIIKIEEKENGQQPSDPTPSNPTEQPKQDEPQTQGEQQSDIEKMQNQDKYDDSKVKQVNGDSTDGTKSESKDGTTSKGKLPDSGLSTGLTISILVSVIIALISFMGYKKNKNI